PLPGAFRAAGTGRRPQARTVRACSAYGAGPRRRAPPEQTPEHIHPCPPAKEAAMPLTFPQMPDTLTANEAAVLEYITRNSDSFLFMSIAQLAAALDVSEATISRFARHVGCRDFKHLKQLVLEQTQPARPGPAGKLAATLADGDGALLPR